MFLRWLKFCINFLFSVDETENLRYNIERISVPEMRTGKIISEDKMKKLIMTLVVVVLAGLLLVGCMGTSYEPMTFYKGKMSIQLNTGFTEKGSSNYDAVYISQKIGVYVTETKCSEFDLPEEAEKLSVKEYAELLAAEYDAEVKLDKWLVYFVHEEQVNDKEYTYYTVVFKDDASFWCIEFATLTENFEALEQEISDYAWSVEFA